MLSVTRQGFYLLLLSHCFTILSLQPFAVDVGYERFLGPEIFFHPEVRTGSVHRFLTEVHNLIIPHSVCMSLVYNL